MRIKKFNKYTKLLVTWEDIKSNSSWTDSVGVADARTAIVTTLGFYLCTQKRALKVAHSVADDNDSDLTVIPWGCVKDIKELEIK